MERDIRAASVQFTHTPSDKQCNLSVMHGFVERAQARRVDVIAFPEMCVTGYWHLRALSRRELIVLAERVPEGPTTGTLVGWASRHRMSIGAGLIEKDSEGALYNTYVVAMPDGRVARHRKLHCFVSEHMSCGEEFTVFDSPHGCRIGVLTCYDNNLFENTRITALLGAEVLLAPHQTGGCAGTDARCMGSIDRALWDARETDPDRIRREVRGPKGRGWIMKWLPSRAHDNGIFVIFANGVGPDDDEIRTGNAMVLDPYGEVVAETDAAGDDMVVADLCAELLVRPTGRLYLRARRPGLYGRLCEPTGMEQDMRAVRFPDPDTPEPRGLRGG